MKTVVRVIAVDLFATLLLLGGCDIQEVEEGDGGPSDAGAVECERVPLDQCYRGGVFAECEGTAEPVVGCSQEKQLCLWFVGGCLAQTFEPAADAWAAGNLPFGPLTPFWGSEPWTRERALNLAVVEDDDESEMLDVLCQCDVQMEQAPPVWREAECFRGGGICEGERLAWVWSGWNLPNTMMVVDVYRLDQLAGYSLIIEAAPSLSRARACLVPFSDISVPMPEPLCASEGLVRVSSRGGLSFEAKFPSFGPVLDHPAFVEALEIRGQIP